MKKKVLFIDRDGTIIKEPEDEQIDSIDKLKFLPGVLSNLGKIARELDFELVMVSNQDGLGTDSFPEETFWPAHKAMMKALDSEQIQFADILIDKSFPADNLPTRKPGTGMLNAYIYGNYDLANSYVLGDRLSDVELAKNLGSKSIFLGDEPCDEATFKSSDWNEIYTYLKGLSRIAEVKRTTKETDILCRVNLDGGSAEISTGLNFFDHMLDQIARHGNIGLQLQVNGDLEVDEHHTIEDVALVLGQAIREALGSKKGIARYGFFLPMDDSSAQVGVDFGGRPFLVFDAEFKREYVGDLPTELVQHFFRSFADAAQCNINISVAGENEHHRIEAIFKAFARAVQMAVKITNEGSLPSTKGVL